MHIFIREKESFMVQEAMMENIFEKVKKKDSLIEKKKSYSLIEKLYYNYQLKKIAKKIDYNNYLEKNKEICGGRAVLKNTRIRPENILFYIENNIQNYPNDFDSLIAKVKEEYPALDEEKVLVSLLYCIKKSYL